MRVMNIKYLTSVRYGARDAGKVKLTEMGHLL